MQCSKLLGFIILVMIYFHPYESCSVSEVRKCQDYNLIAGMIFHGFISEGRLDFLCRQLRTTIKCAYEKGRLESCSLLERLTFDTQLAVINAVCVLRKKEYLKSSPCFSKQDVSKHISTRCLPMMASSKMDTCGKSDLVVECVRTKVLTTCGCNPADSDLMVDLMKRFLQPIRAASNCSNSKTAGKNEQEIVGDGTMQANINSVLVMKSSSQKPLLTDHTTINKSFYGIDGGDTQTATYESSEQSTLDITASTSTVSEPEDFQKTLKWSTKSGTLELESENANNDHKNVDRSISQPNKTSIILALKSTNRYENAAAPGHSEKSLPAMLFSSIMSLVLLVN